MLHCPNKNTTEWKSMVKALGEPRAYYYYNLKNGDFLTEKELENIINNKNNTSNVKYELQLVDIISKKYDTFKKLFYNFRNKSDFFKKLLDSKYGIAKEQVLLLEALYDNQSFDDLMLDYITNYSYTVEINTAKELISDYGNSGTYIEGDYEFTKDSNDTYWKQHKSIFDDRTKISKEEYESKSRGSKNTQIYSNLTVPGGTNYTENEISTPLITPSIKGHAQFATDKGIGWFRSDDKHPFTGFLEDLIASGTIKKVPCG